jgi:hypothetical protein
VKKLVIEETKTTFKTDIIKVGLVFSISSIFIIKISHEKEMDEILAAVIQL